MKVKDIHIEILRKPVAFSSSDEDDIQDILDRFVAPPQGVDLVAEFREHGLEEVIRRYKDQVWRDHVPFLAGALYPIWKKAGVPNARDSAADLVKVPHVEADKSRRIVSMCVPEVAELVKAKSLRVHYFYYLVLLPDDLQREFCDDLDTLISASNRVRWISSATGKEVEKEAERERKMIEVLRKKAERAVGYERAISNVVRKLREPGALTEFQKAQLLSNMKTLAPQFPFDGVPEKETSES